MDYTKEFTKKLAGAAAGTAAWCTNVGNEHGQVLVSVMTAGEGQALGAMADGLMKRYREAGKPPPKILYVDRDCCSQPGPCWTKTMFAEWDFLTLAHCQLQFGMYQGQRFRLLMENNIGYALYLLENISKESAQANPMSENKQLLLQYASQIKEVKEELEKFHRKMGMQAKARETGDQGWLMVEFGEFQGQSMKEVYEDTRTQKLINYLVRADARPNTNMAVFRSYVLKRRASASSTSAPPPAASTSSAPPPAATTSSEASTSPAPPPAASGNGAWKKSIVKALLARKLMAPVKSCE